MTAIIIDTTMKIIGTLAAAVLSLFMQYGTSVETRFDPTTTWPYIYEDFSPGSVFAENGNTIEYNLLNVNLVNNTLHYVKDGIIMQVDMKTVYVVRIKEQVYLNVQGELMEVINETENGAVVLHKEIDKDKMSRANIGYGTSPVASTQNIGLFALEGSLGGLNKSLSASEKDKFSGDNLELKKTTYLVVDGLLVPANKKEILSDGRFDTKQTENFFKTHKVKWNKTEDLSSLVEFLHTVKAN